MNQKFVRPVVTDWHAATLLSSDAWTSGEHVREFFIAFPEGKATVQEVLESSPPWAARLVAAMDRGGELFMEEEHAKSVCPELR